MSQMLRGFEDWYIDTKVNPLLLGTLMDQILDLQMEMTGLILREVGSLVDIVINLDDLALQDRLLVSPATYQQLLEPRLCRLYEFIKSNTKAKILHHTDGAIKPLIPSLIEMGIDAINPLQVSAKGMDDLEDLKNKYGDRLTFWGGIDTQYLLPYGTPHEVHHAVEKTLNILNRGGGYVLTPVHNIQNDVPPENIIAVYEAALGKQICSFK
jgi:uroporphyrinogen decarboxylase